MTCEDCEYSFLDFVSDESNNVCKTVNGWLKPLMPSIQNVGTFLLGIELATFDLRLIRLLGAFLLMIVVVSFIYNLGKKTSPKTSTERKVEQPRWQQ